jgi:hypothetical protein
LQYSVELKVFERTGLNIVSYLMRFILTEGVPPSLDSIDGALKAIDMAFAITRDAADGAAGDLHYSDEIYGEIEINQRGDPLCDEDIEDFKEELNKQDDPNRVIALDALARATGMIVLRVLRAGHENPAILNHLWDWLFATRAGLLQVDEEGFFDHERLVVSIL